MTFGLVFNKISLNNRLLMLLIFASNFSPEINLFLNILNMPKIQSLAAINESVSNVDLVTPVLRGLGPDYAMLVTAIFNIPPLPSFPDLRARLLSFESQLTTIIETSNSSHPTAFVTTRGRGRGRGEMGQSYHAFYLARGLKKTTNSLRSVSLVDPTIRTRE